MPLEDSRGIVVFAEKTRVGVNVNNVNNEALTHNYTWAHWSKTNINKRNYTCAHWSKANINKGNSRQRDARARYTQARRQTHKSFSYIGFCV